MLEQVCEPYSTHVCRSTFADGVCAVTIVADQDAFVRGGAFNNTNFGTLQQLQLMNPTNGKEEDTRIGYLRFSNVNPNTVEAHLKLTVNQIGASFSQGSTLTVCRVLSVFSELSIT